jgi:hypothetical protein
VWLQKADPKTDGAARDWVAIYDECSRILYQEVRACVFGAYVFGVPQGRQREAAVLKPLRPNYISYNHSKPTARIQIDYTLEGKNADEFRENFKDLDWIKVPRVYWQYSTSEILVLEYCPGTKINNGEAIDKMGLDRQRLARLAVESYLQQILRHGFFHVSLSLIWARLGPVGPGWAVGVSGEALQPLENRQLCPPSKRPNRPPTPTPEGRPPPRQRRRRRRQRRAPHLLRLWDDGPHPRRRARRPDGAVLRGVSEGRRQVPRRADHDGGPGESWTAARAESDALRMHPKYTLADAPLTHAMYTTHTRKQVPTGDRLAVRRTAQFFLTAFTERLEQQKKERQEKVGGGRRLVSHLRVCCTISIRIRSHTCAQHSHTHHTHGHITRHFHPPPQTKGAAYSADYKPQRSKDEAKERRKAIVSSIGEVCVCVGWAGLGWFSPAQAAPSHSLAPTNRPTNQHHSTETKTNPQDLLVAANDQPFRFPATFTFVVRSFTVLDGIGKSLDPR